MQNFRLLRIALNCKASIYWDLFHVGNFKNNLTFEKSESSAIVQILDAKDWSKPESWGVSVVYIKTDKGDEVLVNTFEIESNGKGDTYNVYVNPVAGEWFLIEKKGAEIHIQLSENMGGDRNLLIQIDAASKGDGEVRIFQKGK
ncbi:MAG: hypothetical protein LBQ73_06555 [Tannerellaceae bacterium]|jgi:hypothetical protein|nr:hypothetical protein [Tannerellaceae bacterium]